MNRKDLLTRTYSELCVLAGVTVGLASKLGHKANDLIDIILNY